MSKRRNNVKAKAASVATPPVGQDARDPAEVEERTRLCAAYRAELDKRQLSNTENLDKSILSYSSAGLALSLGFLKDIAPPGLMVASDYLYRSWALFIIAIIATIISYPTSHLVLKYQQEKAERYYIQWDDDAHAETRLIEKVPYWLGIIAAVCFVVAVGMTAYFVYENVRNQQMSKNQPPVASQKVSILDGATGMSMQPATTGQKGATGIPMQPAAKPTSTSGQQSPAGTTTSGNK